MPDSRMSEDRKLVEMWTQMGRQTGGLIGRSIGLTSYGLVSIMAGLLAPAVLLNSVILNRNRRYTKPTVQFVGVRRCSQLTHIKTGL